jgi:hypothetical protein
MAANGGSSGLRRLLRRTFGLWPVLEFRNRIMMAPSLPRLVAFETREVRRLLGELGARPAARIAVIMPTYKRPVTLLEAIDSVLKQELQDFVIMVVDDGAGLPKLPDDPRVHGVSLSRNSAVLGLVRNVGIRLTESRFIAFLDDDNTWRPDHLTLTIGALEAGADFVYTDLRRRTAEGVDIDVLSADFDRRTYADRSNTVDSNAIALRRTKRAIFSRLPRTRHTLPKEDWEFVWRQTRGARVQHIAEPTVNYLVNLDSYYTTWKVEPEG